jgi:hypothetical protein
MKTTRPSLILAVCAGLLIIVGVLLTVWWQLDGTGAPEVLAAVPSEAPDDTARPAVQPPLDGDQRLRFALDEATTESGRVAALDAFLKQADAKSATPTLRSTMIADPSAKVRVRAFEVARDLALREDRDALISVLREGVRNPYGEVRREGIRSCRDHPHYELMDELLSIVNQGGSDRSVAIQALAFLDDPEAQKKVLETAQSTDVSREERIQAITLLSQSDLDEAAEYLQSLATGDDPELKGFAMEALAIRQKRNK